MPGLLVVALMAAAPMKLATVPFLRSGIEDGLAGLVQDTLASRLAEHPGLQVTTPRDVTALLGLERQKQLLGCADDSASCMAELGGALGVDGLVTGSIGRAGKSYQLNVKVLDATGAKTLFVYTSDLLASEDALLAEGRKVAELIAERLAEGRAPDAPSTSTHWAPWILVGTGVAVAGTGAVFAVLANGQLSALNGGSIIAPSTPESVRDQGKTYQAVSIALLASGGAMIAGGLIWRYAFPQSPVTAAAWVAPGTAQLSLRVELP